MMAANIFTSSQPVMPGRDAGTAAMGTAETPWGGLSEPHCAFAGLKGNLNGIWMGIWMGFEWDLNGNLNGIQCVLITFEADLNGLL